MRRILLGMAISLLAFAVNATPPNAVQETEWSFDWPDEGYYFSCLNDTLNGTIYVTTRSHSFATPSGIVHVIENHQGIGYVYSKTTGNTWIVRFAIPMKDNTKIAQGETYKYVDRENYIPDEGNGKHFFIELWWNMTVNANGELVVERILPSGFTEPNDASRCVGKPN